MCVCVCVHTCNNVMSILKCVEGCQCEHIPESIDLVLQTYSPFSFWIPLDGRSTDMPKSDTLHNMAASSSI